MKSEQQLIHYELTVKFFEHQTL
ncbi:conserved protein of unknown function [Xenorhabdus doucetiae]|uniref:Uncharacterized protein n=1 Tax=Xenorhabdus doucetiae TaxID=351671 RepID=A0A068QPK9_9GAMM|nr:conserved protein of unknown function [Xenorhabdus doucetiae]